MSKAQLHWLIPTVIGVVLIVVVAAAAFGGSHLAQKRGRGGKHHHLIAGITAVEAAKAVTGTATSNLSISGSITATSELSITAATSARLSAVYVTPSEQVVKGQTIATLYNPTAASQLAQAQAALATAEAKLQAAEAGPTPQQVALDQANVEKAQVAFNEAQQTYQNEVDLYDQGKASEQELTQAYDSLAEARATLSAAQAQAALDSSPPPPTSLTVLEDGVISAKAALATIKATLAEDTITAPFSGMITSVSATPGEVVGPGTTIATIQSNQLVMEGPLSEQDLPLVNYGDSATVTIPVSNDPLVGHVTAIAPSGNPSSLTFTVTISLQTQPSWLKSGESALAPIVTKRFSPAVLVPASAIVNINGHPQVFVITTSATGNSTVKSKGTAVDTTPSTSSKTSKKGRGKGKHRHIKKEPDSSSPLSKSSTPTVRLVNVTPSLSNGSDTMVTGITGGTELVAVGQTYLAPGDKVRITGMIPVPSSLVGTAVGGALTAPVAAASTGTPLPSTTSKGAKGTK